MSDRNMDQNRFPEDSGAQKKTRPLNAEDLFAAIGEVDEELLARAEEEEARPASDRRLVWRQRTGILAAAAACLLITFIGISFVRHSGMQSAPSSATQAEYADQAVAEEAAEAAPMEAAAEEELEEAAPTEAAAEPEEAVTMGAAEAEEAAPAEAAAESAPAAAEAREAEAPAEEPAEMMASSAEAEEASQFNEAAKGKSEASDQAMDYAAQEESPLILVSFRHEPDEKELKRFGEQYGLKLVYYYRNLGAAAFAPEEELSEEELGKLLESLREDALVRAAEQDQAAEQH